MAKKILRITGRLSDDGIVITSEKLSIQRIRQATIIVYLPDFRANRQIKKADFMIVKEENYYNAVRDENSELNFFIFCNGEDEEKATKMIIAEIFNRAKIIKTRAIRLNKLLNINPIIKK